jgi:hypothetical protein
MKKLVVLTLIVLVAALVFAQSKAEPKYDKSTEVTLKGTTVEEVKMVPGTCCKQSCEHLVLKTDKGLLEVQIAPEAFLKELEVTFAKGDKIDVTVSKVSHEGGDVYLARELNRGGSVLVVRDAEGGPVWTWMTKG